MFCTESCEHGCNATSTGKLISGNGASSQTPQPAQQQFGMCYAPVSSMQAPELGGKCEAEPPRVGMCLVTESPEGLSIDCNVPLPNSFNLDEYRKQMVCSCCPPAIGCGYMDGFCLPQPAPASLNPIQTPACSFQCQCCPVDAGASSGFETRSMPATTPPALGACSLPCPPVMPPRLEQSVPVVHNAPGTTVVPQIFCLAAPTPSMPETDGSCYPPDHQPPAYLYYLVPAQSMPPFWNVQAINLVPVAQPLPQQQFVTNPAQNSQLPTQQLLRYDQPFPRLLSELRRERDRSCSEPPAPQPLAFQLYAPAPMVTFCDPPVTTPSPSLPPKDVPAPTPSPDLMSFPSTPPSPTAPPPTPDSAGLPRVRSGSSQRSRTCLRQKEVWDSSAAPQSHAPYPSAAQHGAGNVGMKCGNCWHCPRCNCCSNCFWHPGLVRAPSRDTR